MTVLHCPTVKTKRINDNNIVAQHSNILKQAWGGPCKPTKHRFPFNFTFSDKFKAHCEALGDTYKNTKLSAAMYFSKLQKSKSALNTRLLILTECSVKQ